MSHTRHRIYTVVVILTSMLLVACSSSKNPPNTPPVAGAAVTTSIDEGAATITGQLESTDPDDGATATFTVSDESTPPAGFVLNADGSFSFDPTDTTYDHLNVGAIVVLTIPVTVTDDRGATDSTQIQITVNGTNDAPVAGAAVTDSVNVGAASISGQVTVTDVDDGATAIFAITGGASAPAGLVLNTDGSFSFDPADAAYATLNAGDNQVVVADVTVTDDQSATDTTQIQITVSGVNNIPVAVDDSFNTFGNTLLEAGVVASGSIALKVSGSVLDNDSDLDLGDVLTVSLDSGPVSGSVTLSAQGNFSYVPLVGETSVTDSFVYRVSDGSSSSTATVSINITERIWYVDNRSGGGSGTSSDPFGTLAQAEIVAANGDTIYIANGDGSGAGLDAGLTLAVPNVSLIGEGEALVINSISLAPAGTAPTITNTGGAGITLNAADNTLIMGFNIDGVLSDGLVINDSTGVVVDGISISNSGESAIQGGGADVEIALTDVIIASVDTVDPTVSDDAVFIAATTSSALTMNGGSISGVPGNLGDGIEFENVDSTNPVSMNVDIRGVTFSGIQQDGIKLDNENGVVNVQIGGTTIAEGNSFDAGLRGIHIKTDVVPALSPDHSILIQNNNITSANEGVQIRNITHSGNLSILGNTLNRAAPISNPSDLIDVQVERSSNSEARINDNNVSSLSGTDGIKVRVFDGATLTMEAQRNAIDGPEEGFDFDVIETDASATDFTTLNTTVVGNTLSNITGQAMNARNVNSTSITCLDLRDNTPATPLGIPVTDYVLDTLLGDFLLTTTSQVIRLDPLTGAGTSDPGGPCPLPTF